MNEGDGFEEAVADRRCIKKTLIRLPEFLLSRKFEENDKQLDLAVMSLLWPRSSDEIVILRPRESSGI